jgi:transketolase
MTDASIVWAKDIRRKIIEMAHNAGKMGLHIGSALSAVDILAVLYSEVLKYDVNNPLSPNRDYFILSKGHAYLAFYAVLAEAGFISDNEINENFMKDGGFLPAHSVMCLDKGIEFSSGSLGMGMPFAVGKAFALKSQHKQNQVFTLVGDGECDEGSVFEAFGSAANLQLDNLTVVVDKNGFQQDGKTDDVLSIDIEAVIRAYKWNVICVNGHNHSELINAFNTKFNNGKPKCIIAETVKGKGISFMENNNFWHHANMNQKQYQQALEELQ